MMSNIAMNSWKLFFAINFCLASIYSQDIYYLPGSTQKIEQLVGDYDRQLDRSTSNLTDSKYKIWGTDLGVSFLHKSKTFFLFGDIPGDIGYGPDRDPIAYSEDIDPEDGLHMTFVSAAPGLYQPITIPQISHGAFEVPVDGISIHDTMYVYFISGDPKQLVLARSVDEWNDF